MKIVFEDLEIKIINPGVYKNDLYQKRGSLFNIIKNLINRMIIRKIRMKKILAGFLAALIMFMQSPYSLIIAQTPPSAPEAPVAPTPPPTPENTIETPIAPVAPTPPVAPSLEEFLNPTPTPSPTPKPPKVKPTDATNTKNYTNSPATTLPEQPSGGNVNADTNIGTGDANNIANVATTGNSNITNAPSAAVIGTSSGVTVVNTGNGSGSSNTGSVGIVGSTNTIQNNAAVVGNNLTQTTITGNNDASRNTGGDSTISTGDANTTGTILNSLNTNIAGIGVYEFNIVDDHLGDYVLDLSKATCVSGCNAGGITTANTGNGAASENIVRTDFTENNNTFQNNDVQLGNNMILISDSGGNTADKNTNGDSFIETGDANVAGNILNFVNNNFAGEVVYAVVNVFGNLIGDIILPDGTVLSCCSGSVNIKNSENGADSINTATADQSTSNNTYQFNNVNLENNLIFDASTGGNETSKNTGGNSSIETGNSNILAQVTNITNLNLLGGNYWLVIVNEAGRWIGKILGASGNANYAGSEIFEFTVDEYGQIIVANSGNGAGSLNNAGVNQEVNNTIVQNNNANIVNNVYLSANTGDNSASKNTNGDSNIKTGDANIIANIVNFVNNNIVGSGSLFITVVNVFGSWIGDFVGPGQTKEVKSQVAVGGVSNSGNSQNSSNDSSSATTDSNQGEDGVNSYESSSSTKQAVLGLFKNFKTSKDISSSDEESDDQVVFAGTYEDTTAGDKVVNINLAWLIFAIPFVAIYFIARKKKFTSNRFLPLANKGNA